jgi:hypothetical protein
VAALGHARSGRMAKANRTGRVLGLSGDQDLHDLIPVQMYVGVDALRAIIASWVHYEAIIRMDVAARKVSRAFDASL